MHVTRFADAKSYEAPNHRDVHALRLQGFMDGGPKTSWLGLSHFLPGGGAGPDASPLEKIYLILEGEMTVTVDGQETVLRRLDSCTIPAHVSREIANHGNAVCTMAVVMPYPPGSPS